eukprot:gene8791-739_t
MIPIKEKNEALLNINDILLTKTLKVLPKSQIYSAETVDFNKIPTKSIMIEVFDSTKFKKPQEEEIKRLNEKSELKHPNLLKKFGNFENQGKFFSVSERIEVYLSDLISYKYPKGITNVSLIATVLQDILKGLNYIHSKEQYQGHLCTNHILIDSTFTVLLDPIEPFYEDLSPENCWISPELLKEKKLSIASDIWSFGVLCLEISSGVTPKFDENQTKFKFTNIPALLNMQNDLYCNSFKAMVDLCLRKNPNERPDSNELLKHDFFLNSTTTDSLYSSLYEHLNNLDNLKTIDDDVYSKWTYDSTNSEEDLVSPKNGISNDSSFYFETGSLNRSLSHQNIFSFKEQNSLQKFKSAKNLKETKKDQHPIKYLLMDDEEYGRLVDSPESVIFKFEKKNQNTSKGNHSSNDKSDSSNEDQFKNRNKNMKPKNIIIESNNINLKSNQKSSPNQKLLNQQDKKTNTVEKRGRFVIETTTPTNSILHKFSEFDQDEKVESSSRESLSPNDISNQSKKDFKEEKIGRFQITSPSSSHYQQYSYSCPTSPSKKLVTKKKENGKNEEIFGRFKISEPNLNEIESSPKSQKKKKFIVSDVKKDSSQKEYESDNESIVKQRSKSIKSESSDLSTTSNNTIMKKEETIQNHRNSIDLGSQPLSSPKKQDQSFSRFKKENTTEIVGRFTIADVVSSSIKNVKNKSENIKGDGSFGRFHVKEITTSDSNNVCSSSGGVGSSVGGVNSNTKSRFTISDVISDTDSQKSDTAETRGRFTISDAPTITTPTNTDNIDSQTIFEKEKKLKESSSPDLKKGRFRISDASSKTQNSEELERIEKKKKITNLKVEIVNKNSEVIEETHGRFTVVTNLKDQSPKSGFENERKDIDNIFNHPKKKETKESKEEVVGRFKIKTLEDKSSNLTPEHAVSPRIVNISEHTPTTPNTQYFTKQSTQDQQQEEVNVAGRFTVKTYKTEQEKKKQQQNLKVQEDIQELKHQNEKQMKTLNLLLELMNQKNSGEKISKQLEEMKKEIKELSSEVRVLRKENQVLKEFLTKK